LAIVGLRQSLFGFTTAWLAHHQPRLAAADPRIDPQRKRARHHGMAVEVAFGAQHKAADRRARPAQPAP
jgi:hypothetical protein